MQDKLIAFERLAAHAHGEAAPEIDVSHQVIYRLEGSIVENFDRPLAFFAFSSMAAAILFTSMSTSLIETISDPMSALFHLTPMLGQ